MRNVPATAALPAQLLDSPVWTQFFKSLLGDAVPLADPMYKPDGLLTYAWALALHGHGLPPLRAPIVDNNSKVTLPWLNYMTLLP